MFYAHPQRIASASERLCNERLNARAARCGVSTINQYTA
jgi:hypothetical protein